MGMLDDTMLYWRQRAEKAEAEIERLNLRVEALSWEILDCPNCEALYSEIDSLREELGQKEGGK